MAPSSSPPTTTWRRSITAPSREEPRARWREMPPAQSLPPLHRPFELGLRRAVRPHQLVLLGLELDQVGRGEDVLAGLVVFDAAIAHHQLVGLEVGRLERGL